MTGKILGINEDKLNGIIKGEDGKRYNFSIDSIKNSSEINVQDDVDFVVDGIDAIEIYVTKSSALDMKKVNDSVMNISSKIKSINFPKFSLKNNLPFIGGILLLIFFVFNYYKNSIIEEEFIKSIKNEETLNIKYTDYNCTGWFSTDCYLEEIQVYSDGKLQFEAELFEITNISGLGKIKTTSKLDTIPFSVEIEGIKISENIENDFTKGLSRFLGRPSSQEKEVIYEVYKYLSSKLNSNSINFNGLVEVANNEISSIEINKLSYDNDISPILVNFKLSNLDATPSLNSFDLKINTENVFGLTYEIFKHFEKNDKFKDTMKKLSENLACLDKEEYEEKLRKFLTAIIKEEHTLIDTYKTPLLNIVAKNAEGIMLSFKNKDNYTLDQILFIYLKSRGNIFALNNKLQLKIETYGDLDDDILSDFNDKELDNFKNSIITKIKDKDKDQFAYKAKINEKLINLESQRKVTLDNLLKQHIEKNIINYKENILPVINDAYMTKKYMETYNNTKYKKVVLNNKEYTLDNAFRKLKEIKIKAPDKLEEALKKVVNEFVEFGYDGNFLVNHLKNSLEKNKYDLRLRYSNYIVNFSSKIDLNSDPKIQLNEIYGTLQFTIPYELKELQTIVKSYNSLKNTDTNLASLYKEEMDLKGKLYSLENKLRYTEFAINEVKTCKSRACLELINFKNSKICN